VFIFIEILAEFLSSCRSDGKKKNEVFLRFLDLETLLDKKDQNRVKEGYSFVIRDYWNLKRG